MGAHKGRDQTFILATALIDGGRYWVWSRDLSRVNKVKLASAAICGHTSCQAWSIRRSSPSFL